MMNNAQVKISCRNLNQEVEFFIQLGFKLLQVFPADNPRVMVLSGFDLNLRIERGLPVNDLTVILPNNSTQSTAALVSPSGVTVQFQAQTQTSINLNVVIPEQIECTVTLFDEAESWVTGRAGMLYRDLIPSRLSGAIIASNIKIPDGGPVPDHVHYHNIQFQLIFCTKGWVKVVYEDQGEAIILKAGDCVTQPPGIRHQVLEASDGLEVVEIGLPAEHMTTLDYQMKLPTGQYLPERLYNDGTHTEQKFCHHQQSAANWNFFLDSGLMHSETSIVSDSGGLAAVNVIKTSPEVVQDDENKLSLHHQNALCFYYLMAGQVTFQQAGQESIELHERDGFVLPRDQAIELSHFSDGFKCIEFVWLDN